MAYNGRGCLYFGSGEFEKAARDFRMAYEISPVLVVADINYSFASAYASKLITLANILEKKPGITFESLNQQYPSVLKDQRQQFQKKLSTNKDLLSTDLAFLSSNKFSSLVDRNGWDKVNTAMSRELVGFQSRVTEYSLAMQKELKKFEIKDVLFAA